MPIFIISLFFSYSLYGAELKTIQFRQVGEMSQLELTVDDEKIEANKFNVTEDKQIILDLKNTSVSDRVSRGFDTSEFSGGVVYVSTYKKPGSEKDLRITLQLRDNVRSVLNRQGNKLILLIENRYGVFSKEKEDENKTFEAKVNDAEGAKIHVPKSESIEDILENLTVSGRKKYIGKKISFNVKEAAVEDILKMIADSSGFNIILTDELKNLAPLTLNLTNIPWDQALDTILGLNRLVAKKNGVILMVTTIEKATAELQAEINQKKLAEGQEPLVTKIFPISYADIGDIAKILSEYLTATRGKISTEPRTNSLIVKDTAEVIDKMRKIVEALDTQTPQVLIEAKIVEVTEAYAKELGLKNGMNWGYDPIGIPSQISGPIRSGATTAAAGSVNSGPGFSFSSAPTADTRNLFGVRVAQFGRLLNLEMTLQLMESESKGKIVSSPKVITQNKKQATINTQDQVPFLTSISLPGGTVQSQVQQSSATLSLTVTPQVTNEGAIIMDIALQKSQFGSRVSNSLPPTTQSRSMQTNVLVDNGSSIVIGGIYNYTRSENHSGVLFLQDIPILGWLFRTPYNPTVTKTELIIFLTPRIINQEEAGLSSGSENS